MSIDKIAIASDGRQEDLQASEAFTPGELLEYGGSNDVQKHSTAGGTRTTMFALEGDEYGNDLDDDFSSGETATVCFAKTGDKINALLGTGSSEVNISKGDFLESAGDGTLQAAGTAADTEYSVVAQAAEAVDNSSATTESRIKVEVV